MIDIKKTAKFLLNNRLSQQLVDNIPDTLYPLSPEEAYLVQQAGDNITADFGKLGSVSLEFR